MDDASRGAREGDHAPPWFPLPPSADPQTAVVLREFFALGRLHRQAMHRACARHCLHPAQAMCVAVLAHGGELAQSELADALVLSRPGVTRLVQRMERGGLVMRRPDDIDQRQTMVSLTPAGRELQHRMLQATTEYAVRMLALLPAPDRADLARILPEWRRRVEAAQK